MLLFSAIKVLRSSAEPVLAEVFIVGYGDGDAAPNLGDRWSNTLTGISKHDVDLFTYSNYLVLFSQNPCHLNTSKTSKFGLGLYKWKKK